MTSEPLRIVFAGTPEFAARHLRTLIDNNYAPVAVYTQPDRPTGRGKRLLPGPVKQLATSSGIAVFQPESLKDELAQKQLAELNADLLIVVAYGLILPQPVLDTPRLGCLNVHASLLPRWRGAAPIQRAIQAGDSETGITIMQMDAGLDTGAMLASQPSTIAADTTAASLHDELALIGGPLLLEVLNDLNAFQKSAVVQDDSQATYAHKILKPEAQMDWSADADLLERDVRAFNPFPVCFTNVGELRLKVWGATARASSSSHSAGTVIGADREGIRVRCGQGELCITRAQLAGGKVLEVGQILQSKGDLFSPGTTLGAV